MWKDQETLAARGADGKAGQPFHNGLWMTIKVISIPISFFCHKLQLSLSKVPNYEWERLGLSLPLLSIVRSEISEKNREYRV